MDGKEMYKKAWCTCKVVVLRNKPIAFLTSWLPSPSSLLRLPIVPDALPLGTLEQRWPPLPVSARSCRSYEKIGDCEQSSSAVIKKIQHSAANPDSFTGKNDPCSWISNLSSWKRTLKKFRVDRNSNPDLCDDWTQYSIHFWANQANWSRSRPLWVGNIPDGGSDLKLNIWSLFQFKIWFISYISLYWRNCWKCLPPFVSDFF